MSTRVVICGGGLVGCTLASALALDGMDVVVIEAKSKTTIDTSLPDARVSAITRASQNIFSTLGVWQKIDCTRAQAFRKMHVWNRPAYGEVSFDSAEIAEPDLGHIIENHVLESALLARLGEQTNVQWIRPARLTSFTKHNRVRLVADGQSLETDLIVGADGANSQVRTLAGIEADKGSYNQVAVVAIVECLDGHAETAWQRFLATGPVAVLPMYEGYACIVWSTTPEAGERLLKLSCSAFDDDLASVLGDHLGRLRSVGKRYVFPLHWAHAKAYVLDRLALIGDAAHTIHPLAGQGVNLGIYDAAVLAEVMQTARRSGRDPSRRSTLRKYERWRRGHNALMQFTMAAFTALFANPSKVVDEARNFGLKMTNDIAPLKRLIMRHASGLSGDLPTLAKALR